MVESFPSPLGLRNMLLLTGDPLPIGPYPDATAVSDVEGIGLANHFAKLNKGIDPGNNPIGEPTRFVVGVKPVAIEPAHELKRFHCEGGGWHRLCHHAAGVRPGGVGVIPKGHLRSAAPSVRRRLAAVEFTKCRGPRQ